MGNTPQQSGADVASPLRIVSLAADAFKRLTAVEITPDPSSPLVRITGKNGAGKSSVLDAIEAALAGGRALPDRPVRAGHQGARVVVDLGEIIVRRTFTRSGGGSLVVEAKDGTRYTSPQAVLDRLVGDLTFDPFSFLRMEPKRQVAVLASAMGLDAKLDEIDARRRTANETATAARRVLKSHELTLAGLPRVEPGPVEEIPAGEVLARLKAAREVERANSERRRAHADAVKKVEGIAARVREAADEVEDAKKRLEEAERALDVRTTELHHARDFLAGDAREVAALVDPDVEAIAREIEGLEAANAAARARKSRANVEAMIAEARRDEFEATRRVDALAADRERLVAEARLPVPGLTFTDDGLLLNGIPFSQASGAEKLRTSVAVGLAQNPRIRVVLVREGALLDSDGLATLAGIAAEHGAQVWVEQVTDGQRVGIVIEDGHVADVVPEVPGPEPAASAGINPLYSPHAEGGSNTVG